MIEAKRIYVLNKRLVYYRKNRKNSISKNIINRDDYIFLCREFLKEIKTYLIKNKIFEIFEQSYINYCMYNTVNYFEELSFKIQINFLNILEIGNYKINYFYLRRYKLVYFLTKHKILIPVYNLYFRMKSILKIILRRSYFLC